MTVTSEPTASSAAENILCSCPLGSDRTDIQSSVIFVNKNENENGEKQENNEFVNEN